MPSANENLFDALIRHQVYLLRLTGSVRNKINALLNATEEQIAMTIRDRLRNGTALETPADIRKLETLQRIVRNQRLGAWEQVDETWVKEMVDIANSEAAMFVTQLETVSPTILNLITVPAPVLKKIATARPFEGRTLKQWAETIQADDLRRIDMAIRTGMVQQETNAEIARRVVGTARLNGTDGVTQITRRNAEAITRTAIMNIADEVRQETFRQNKDIIDEEQFVATLDSRTTAVCRANDGKRFPLGKGPRPPLHFSCRSIRVPVIGDLVGNRPMKAGTEKQMLREFNEKHGLNAKSRDDLPRGMKGTFDKYSRARMRDLTGTLPAETTYQDWLSRQSREFQDDVLGKTKAKLFRDGNLQLDRFVNRNGDELTLKELASKERAAFVAAGLDPDAY